MDHRQQRCRKEVAKETPRTSYTIIGGDGVCGDHGAQGRVQIVQQGTHVPAGQVGQVQVAERKGQLQEAQLEEQVVKQEGQVQVAERNGQLQEDQLEEQVVEQEVGRSGGRRRRRR